MAQGISDRYSLIAALQFDCVNLPVWELCLDIVHAPLLFFFRQDSFPYYDFQTTHLLTGTAQGIPCLFRGYLTTNPLVAQSEPGKI